MDPNMNEPDKATRLFDRVGPPQRCQAKQLDTQRDEDADIGC
jgi:hypothetical protein